MAWDVPAEPSKFAEAVKWFRERVPLRKEAWLKLNERARVQAFTVAGVAQLDLVHDVFDAVGAAIENGETLEDFKTRIGASLEAAWGETVANPAWRLETIFRTNVQRAYTVGRFEQARDPVVLDVKPVWLFDAVLDSRTTPICKAADGTVLPAEDPWWETHLPPCHFNCRSGFIALTDEQAREFGGVTKRPTTVPAAEGFGLPPTAPDWEPDPNKYAPELWALFKAKESP